MSLPRWLRAIFRVQRERVVNAGDVAFLLEGEAWRRVTPREQPDLFSELDVCRECGCTELRACPGGCFWVGHGLCSRCVAGFGGSD